MDEARARRLQPHYIRAFFMAAFKLLGGRMSERESGRYEIRHVPADIRDRDRQIGLGAPVLTKYERVTFDKELTRPDGKPRADLLAPGHPLLDAVTDLIIERYGTLLKQGTMLADRHDPGDEPRLLVAVTHEITDGHDPARTVTKGSASPRSTPARSRTGCAPPARRATWTTTPLDDAERAVATPLRDAPWLSAGVETIALDWAVTEGMPEELARTRELVTARVAQVRRLVKQRLTGEINYWDMRHAELLDAQSAGRSLKMKPETAYARARDLERRLDKRLAELDRDEELIARPPVISAAALVIPQGLLDKLLGVPRAGGISRRTPRRPTAAPSPPSWPPNAASAASPAKCRITIRATTSSPRCPDGHLDIHRGQGPHRGRRGLLGDQDRGPARQELRHRIPSRDGLRLTPTDREFDAVRYIVNPFRDVDFGDFAATGMIGNWLKEWERGGDPV